MPLKLSSAPGIFYAKPSRPSDALMIQQSGASLAQVMDWGLFDAKVLRKTSMSSYQLGP